MGKLTKCRSIFSLVVKKLGKVPIKDLVDVDGIVMGVKFREMIDQ